MYHILTYISEKLMKKSGNLKLIVKVKSCIMTIHFMSYIKAFRNRVIKDIENILKKKIQNIKTL